MPMKLVRVNIIIFLIAMLFTAHSSNDTLEGCQKTCGDVEIPYPFGIGKNCAMEGLDISCRSTEDGSYKPFVYDMQLTDILLESGEIRIRSPIASQCFNITTNHTDLVDTYVEFRNTGYRASYVKNKFVVIGCESLAYITSYKGNDVYYDEYYSGCGSYCNSTQSIVNGSCSGIACCKTSIAKDISYYWVTFGTYYDNSHIWEYSNCSYGALVEEDWFEFKASYITTDAFNRTNGGYVPVVMDWSIGNDTCEVAQKNKSSYACISNNNVCLNSPNGPGYICNCSDGYQGNPYLLDGCQDINECVSNHPKVCSGNCENIDGSFRCVCPSGTKGNPTINGICIPVQKLALAPKLIIVIGSSLVFLLSLGVAASMVYHNRKLKKLKEKYFMLNGGWLILEELKSKQGLSFKIFSKKEMEEATNNFDTEKVIGRGGHGTVYKGILKDERIVAIKRSKITNDREKKEFAKEMIILSEINHKNIVKLLGCCFEVEVPMLVYEYIPNGTLFHLIHCNYQGYSMSLHTRLRIALESADALAYLHTSVIPRILHGDVKSSNILLDVNFVAKVTDFGGSMFVPTDENQFATLVQGTCGYLDPEYLQTCKLTDKSDVYSFGVVLLELITGKKALYFEGNPEERRLASSFLLAMKENRLNEILDDTIIDEAELGVIEEIVELAKQCIQITGDQRPTMKQVVQRLEALTKGERHPLSEQNPQEMDSLLGMSPISNEVHSSGMCILQKNKAGWEIETGR